MKVSDVMTRNVFTVTADMPLVERTPGVVSVDSRLI